MAPKAQKRSLKTTRPRRNAARIAQERARKAPKRASAGRDDERSGSKRLVTTGRGNKKLPRKTPGRATRVRRREERTEVRRGRFLLLVGFMSVLGFTTVYLGETALETVQGLGEDGEALFDKIVDRLLDRDIPLVDTPKKRAPSKRAASRGKGLEQRPPLPQAKSEPKRPPEVRVEKLPSAPVPKTPRAELPAPSPVEYAREVKERPAPALSEADAARERAARIEALLEKVGVER